MPASGDKKEKQRGYSSHISGAAWGLLVMGISIAAIIGIWITIGAKGPSFSNEVMQQQQKHLREQYGLPPAPELNPKELETPPSLRNFTTTASNNSTRSP